MFSIVIKLIVDLISDKNKHDFYELHKKYRLTPVEIKKAIDFLETHKVLEVEGKEFWLSGTLNSMQLGIIYESIRNRNLKLDRYQLSEIKEKSQPMNELYYPKLDIIDGSLLID